MEILFRVSLKKLSKEWENILNFRPLVATVRKNGIEAKGANAPLCKFIMKINLWYNAAMRQWRWTLSDDNDIMLQESGQNFDLRNAMDDIANTVEYVLQSKFPD